MLDLTHHEWHKLTYCEFIENKIQLLRYWGKLVGLPSLLGEAHHQIADQALYETLSYLDQAWERVKEELPLLICCQRNKAAVGALDQTKLLKRTLTNRVEIQLHLKKVTLSTRCTTKK